MKWEEFYYLYRDFISISVYVNGFIILNFPSLKTKELILKEKSKSFNSTVTIT